MIYATFVNGDFGTGCHVCGPYTRVLVGPWLLRACEADGEYVTVANRLTIGHWVLCGLEPEAFEAVVLSFLPTPEVA